MFCWEISHIFALLFAHRNDSWCFSCCGWSTIRINKWKKNCFFLPGDRLSMHFGERTVKGVDAGSSYLMSGKCRASLTSKAEQPSEEDVVRFGFTLFYRSAWVTNFPVRDTRCFFILQFFFACTNYFKFCACLMRD